MLECVQPIQQYYSFDYRNVHFTVISTELPFGIGTEQYNFVDQDLSQASANSSITWKIVLFHKPPYVSPGGEGPLKGLSQAMHPLFDKYHVDFVLEGHDHNYQRTFPLEYNATDPASPTITTGEKTDYGKYSGEIWIIAGTGGASPIRLTGQMPFVIEQFTGEYGFLDLNFVENGNVVFANFYSNDGKVLDSFTVRK